MVSHERSRLDGKVAFVTGAASGIGRATALALSRAGASVVAADINATANQETSRLVDEAGGRALAVTCDVRSDEAVRAALEQTVATFGRLDVAVNNAGVEQPQAPAADVDVATWNRIVDTDLRGVFLCMQHEIPLILKQGGGAIVNISSGAGVKGFKGQAAYCAAKFGVIGLTKAAALDYAAQQLRINAVAPGMIDTPMMERFTGGSPEGRQQAVAQEPVGRVGSPEEIAHTVVWLCSDAASFITGATVVADGAQTT